MSDSRRVVGADGCRAGWVAVTQDPGTGATDVSRAASFEELLALAEGAAVLAVDMPIGLPRVSRPGGREADRQARRLLGRPRSSSVFSTPARPALDAGSFEEAVRLHTAGDPDAPKLTIYAFHLLPKLREVDRAMTPARQAWVREVHPEVSFAAMAGGEAVAANKKKPEGRARRLALLRAAGFEGVEAAVAEHRGRGVGADDVVDAFACCWSAARIAAGVAERVPPEPPTDARGLRMEIWF